MFRRVNLLEGPVDIVLRNEVLKFITHAVAEGRQAIVANQNLHSLALSRTCPRLRAFFRMADVIEIDSTPLLFWARLLGLKLSRLHRSTYLDWRDAFWRMSAERGWRVFLLGASDTANAEAVARLTAEWPGVTLAGHHGYFEPSGSENLDVVARISAFRPDVLLVGMGMPLQELWVADNYARLDCGVVLPIGAAFDYEAGFQRPAPRLYGELGLEWLFRLVHDPRRLFRRYLIEPWGLLGPALADLTRGSIPTSAVTDTPPTCEPTIRLAAPQVDQRLLAESSALGSRVWGEKTVPEFARPQLRDCDGKHAIDCERNPGDHPERYNRAELQPGYQARHVPPP